MRNSFLAFNAVFGILASVFIFVGVSGLPRETPMDMGTFMAFWAAYGLLYAGLTEMLTIGLELFMAKPYFERLRPIIEQKPESVESGGDPGEVRGNIEFSHISFKYAENGPLILDDVSLSIREGQFVAVTGPSGSGKSTLLRLLLGFEKPGRGTVLIENQDLSQLDAAKVRRQMGVVMQNSGLLPDEIYRNIIGYSSLTMDDAWEAARMAGLEEDIKNMPMGMHTMIAEGASTISGGQKQRIIIARALARKPKVLLLDEATSALDNRTQETVAAGLDALPVTRIVVAHRLSTIRNADLIIVLDKGRVAERGSFSELMAAKGMFHALARRQMIRD
jgi:ATP-binding cassette subfamily C protein